MSKPTLRQLFFQMLTVSAFTFGGGFVIVTLLKKRMVEQRRWLTESEMLDMTAIAQSAPGPIAVNTAVLIGWHLAGFPGMLAAVFGCILPPMAILSAISLFYTAFSTDPCISLLLQGMQAGVAAVVLDAAVTLGQTVAANRSPLQWLLLLSSLPLVLLGRVNPILLLLSAAAAGMLFREKERAR